VGLVTPTDEIGVAKGVCVVTVDKGKSSSSSFATG
jgi:hypothetical protein